jgi:SAM-dependent methyltransferase
MPTYISCDDLQFHVRAHPDCYATSFSVFGPKPRGKLLDLAAGAGYTSHVLQKMGFEVTATEINPEQFLAAGVQVQAVDLNRGLPYPDASFSNILALEIIEHLEAPSRFVREIARVLQPGGTALISTPNITTLGSKLRFAFKHEFNHFYNRPDRLDDPFDERSCGHISPMPLWLLHHFLQKAGLRPVKTHYTRELLGLRGNWISTNLMVEVTRGS